MERPEAKNNAVSDSSDGGVKLPAATKEQVKQKTTVSTVEELLEPTTSQRSKVAPPIKETWASLGAVTETPKYTAVKEDPTSGL